MRLLYKNTMISSLLIALSLMIVGSHLAQAQCTTVASCDTLGFDKDVSKCDTNKPILKCPSDTSKAFCVEKANCTPVVGHIYYSDKSCSADYIVAKNPIGIIFDATNKLVVALEDAPSKMYWDKDNVDITALTNYKSEDVALTDMDGKNNTSKIVAQRGTQALAASYCENYSTIGTNKGDWFLPALGQLKQLYNNIFYVNAGLNKLERNALIDRWYWSSSESYASNAWDLRFSDGLLMAYQKNLNEDYVRPVLAF